MIKAPPSSRGGASDDAPLPLGLLCCGLYLANVALHAVVFAKRNPTTQPGRQNVILMLCRLLFGLPVNCVMAAWLAAWIVFWEIVRRPLWKPRALPLPREDGASVAMCGGGFRTWYHLGVYWGLYDALGAEGVKEVKFSGASIGALVAAVAACGVHPADIWAHIPHIAEAYREDFFGHITKVGQFCRYLLHSTLPRDAHERVAGWGSFQQNRTHFLSTSSRTLMNTLHPSIAWVSLDNTHTCRKYLTPKHFPGRLAERRGRAQPCESFINKFF